MTTSDPRETEHIECDCVPDLGPSHCHLCGERAGRPVPWSEAHPGNHDALLNETDIRLATGFNPGGRQVYVADDERRMRKLATALRTEQSARQMDAEIAESHEGYEVANAERRERAITHRVEAERDALQQRIDAALAKTVYCEPWLAGSSYLNAIRTALTAPAESKEPDHE